MMPDLFGWHALLRVSSPTPTAYCPEREASEDDRDDNGYPHEGSPRIAYRTTCTDSSDTFEHDLLPIARAHAELIASACTAQQVSPHGSSDTLWSTHEPDESAPLKLLARGFGQCRAATRPNTVQHTSTATPSAGNDFDKLPSADGLLKRPPATSSPRVRIEGSAAFASRSSQ
jgi:hypothetical protein